MKWSFVSILEIFLLIKLGSFGTMKTHDRKIFDLLRLNDLFQSKITFLNFNVKLNK